MPPSQLGAFAKSDPNQPSPNIEWHVQPLSLDKFGEPLHRFNAITPSVCNLRPSSRGHIRIKTPDAMSPPAITLNYLSTQEDQKVAVEGLRFTRRIMSAPALNKFRPTEVSPGQDLNGEEDLLYAAAELGTTIFHPVGTCKMGNDAKSVVDEKLRVHQIKNLRIADASIMPTLTSGNTNGPCMMIGEKCADFIMNH